MMTSQPEPLVSVVTPVYNGANYLRECIESVLAQTYTSWTYTIVNNCSTDRTIDIAREYVARDSRIRVVSNDTCAHVVESYNIAVRQTSPDSKYCKVVAADDWLFPECLEKMVRLAEEHPSVAIVGAYCLREMEVCLVGVPYSTNVVPGRAACRSLLLGGPYVFGAPSAVLYRSDIVRSRHAFYNESNLHADLEVCLEFLEHHDFGFVHQVLTFRRMQPDSTTSYSRRINTYLAGRLEGLVRYGSQYLTDQELNDRTRECVREYYHYLGWEVYKLHGPDFWAYHRSKLAAVGHPLRPARVVASAISNALDVALNPKNTVGAAARRLRRHLSTSESRVMGSPPTVCRM
jgi:glycosyltransferase involved in cell wall biosynthesis